MRCGWFTMDTHWSSALARLNGPKKRSWTAHLHACVLAAVVRVGSPCTFRSC
jgi:hypothetical protein|eukprot:COSAG01_NODE_8833_length_2645_cov_1.747840_3_plen_52_part_00